MLGHGTVNADSISAIGMLLCGLASSVHCIGMCGGIFTAVSASPDTINANKLLRQAAYHGGRLVTGMLTGLLLGAAGQTLSVNVHLRVFLPIVTGAVLILLGFLQIIGKEPVRFVTGRRCGLALFIREKGCFIAGLLTPLLPCGALNTAQLYCAGSGSMVAGAAYMGLFILGTIPVQLIYGTSLAALTSAARPLTIRASGVVTLAMGARLLFKTISKL